MRRLRLLLFLLAQAVRSFFRLALGFFVFPALRLLGGLSLARCGFGTRFFPGLCALALCLFVCLAFRFRFRT